jgi:hypothetical protein
MAGKGDNYRPVDPKKWDEGYERIDWSLPMDKDTTVLICEPANMPTTEEIESLLNAGQGDFVLCNPQHVRMVTLGHIDARLEWSNQDEFLVGKNGAD